MGEDHNDIGRQVEERVAAEKKALESKKKKSGGKKKYDSITSKFVMDCLDAEQLGDGMLYAALHKDKYVFAKNSQQWFLWDEHTWRRDDMDDAVSAVENVAMRYAQEIEILEEKIKVARDSGDDDEYAFKKRICGNKISKIRGRISSLRKKDGRKNCLLFAHTNPKNPLAISGREFDLDPWLLGVENGVVNLRTGELEPSLPGDYILKRCRVPYGGLDVDVSVWVDILNSIYDNDTEKIEFMERLYGAAIVGSCSEHVFPVLIGRGRNGKSVMIEVISWVLGDYAGVVPSEILLDSNRPTNHSQSDPVLMSLKGLRLAIASETGEGRKFSAERVKWLTGGDTLSARGLYDKHPTDFDPSHMLVLLTNHEPGAPAGDMAFWERCFLIHHPLSFVRRKPEKDYEREADPELPVKLKEAGSAILTWLVQGCLDWQENGLAPPESVAKSTKDYREEEDYMGQFIEACCNREEGSRTGATPLYEAFVIWYQKNINSKKNYTPSQRTFGGKLRAREEFPTKKIRGVVYYQGLDLTLEYHQLLFNAESGDSGGDSSAWKGEGGDGF